MNAKVTDARMRSDAFDAAWAADDDRALASLHNAPWPGSNVMRARIYARKGLPERVLAEYHLARTFRDRSAETAELGLIAAIQLGACGRRVEAILTLHDAETRIDAGVDRALRVQYGLAVATVELSAGNEREARGSVASALELAEGGVGLVPLAEYRLEINHLRARLYELRAHLHALAHDYAAQFDDLGRAIAVAKLVRRRDYWHEAVVLASISGLVGMSPQHSARRLFAATNAGVRWNSHLAALETTVRLNVARSEMLFGPCDELGVLDPRGAPSLAARLALDADHLLLDVWDDANEYARELELASSLAETIDWGDVPGDEIAGLSALALVLAPHDLRRAHAVKARYDAMLSKLSRETWSFLELRRVAFDDLVAASLAIARGDTATGLEYLDECVAFWAARRMDPWCTIASLERFALTRDAADLEPARRFVREWPRSRFSSRLRTALDEACERPGRPFPYLRAAGAMSNRAIAQ
jgi:hypothetical protein